MKGNDGGWVIGFIIALLIGSILTGGLLLIPSIVLITVIIIMRRNDS